MRFITGRALTPAEVAADLPRLTRSERGLGLWSGTDADGFAGVWFLVADPDDAAAAEIGWRLPRASWGRGLAVEGARALLDARLRDRRGGAGVGRDDGGQHAVTAR